MPAERLATSTPFVAELPCACTPTDGDRPGRRTGAVLHRRTPAGPGGIGSSPGLTTSTTRGAADRRRPAGEGLTREPTNQLRDCGGVPGFRRWSRCCGILHQPSRQSGRGCATTSQSAAGRLPLDRPLLMRATILLSNQPPRRIMADHGRSTPEPGPSTPLHNRLGFVRPVTPWSPRSAAPSPTSAVADSSTVPTCCLRAQVTADGQASTADRRPRDAHLKSPDSFNVEAFPTMTFTSTAGSRTARSSNRRPDHHGCDPTVEIEVEPDGIVTDPWARPALASPVRSDQPRDFG